MITRCMLAADLADVGNDFTKVPYPVMASFKIDGIRCHIGNNCALSRTNKPIQNAFIQRQLRMLDTGLDGELVVMDGNKPAPYNLTESAVMSRDGEPDFSFKVFDYYSHEPFYLRWDHIAPALLSNHYAEHWPHHEVRNIDDLRNFEQTAVDYGYEGVMLRDSYGAYKQGRSTLKEFGLVKVKRWETSVAQIAGLTELLANKNKAFYNERGLMERSSVQMGMVPMNTLGAFEVIHPTFGEFAIGGGPGLTDGWRKQYWDQRSSLVGKYLKFKYQHGPTSGYNKPRSPQFLGLYHSLNKP